MAENELVKRKPPSAVADEPSGRPSWRSLPRGAMGFRVAHVAWGIVELSALTHVWGSALLRRRDRSLWASITLLLVQGAIALGDRLGARMLRIVAGGGVVVVLGPTGRNFAAGMSGGIAFAGARGISGVQVRVDGGEWQDAELRSPLSETTWVIWRYEWPFEEGDHLFEVRCRELDGTPQIEEETDNRPDGATGIHSEEAEITL